MSNVVAIIGRPNVGKSTLFNRLVKRREAIVDPTSGVTRDRHYGNSEWNGKKFTLIDARSRERFEGKIPEPRKGLRSGCIKNSFCIPFNDCLNDDKTFKNIDHLKKIFKTSIENLEQKKIVFSCGSGVTACVLALAYSLINDKYLPCIYDGSWAEYGMI